MFVSTATIDFIITCSLEDSTNPTLDGMELTTLGLGEGIPGCMERATSGKTQIPNPSKLLKFRQDNREKGRKS